MAETSTLARAGLFAIAVVVLVAAGYWYWQSHFVTSADATDHETSRISSDAESALASTDTELADVQAETPVTTAATSARQYDCSGGFDAIIAEYDPELAAELKRLDAQRKFIEAAGPFTDVINPAHASYPGYESYDLATLAALGDNGDSIANVLYAARQLGNVSQYRSEDNQFNSAAFDEHFERLQRALEAGQSGALQLVQNLVRMKAFWASERNQQDNSLSNRAAVIELHAWQAATRQAGTLTERVITAVFADRHDRGAFRLLNEAEHAAVAKRRDELLGSTLRTLAKPLSASEQQAEAALIRLLELLQDKQIAAIRCKDGRTLQQAISETY